MPDFALLREDELRRIERWFTDSGQQFLRLQSRSQYPLECFFDTLVHLNEECQWSHSEAVAKLLRDGRQEAGK